jgi:N6-L-threonylcarbamoyladenine synthase
MDKNSSRITVLGIESSCDETAAAIVSQSRGEMPEIRSNVIFSQIDEHSPYGGVVPEIAARAHAEKLDGIVEKALDEAGTGWNEVDAIAVTAGPGLIGGLIAGLMTAKAIAAALGKPLYAINHLEGHALSPRLIEPVSFPYLLLLVSGGHTQIVLVKGVGQYERWGSTLDDALGEAFDKTAKLLGLGYPGGPCVEAAACGGSPDRHDLPWPMRGVSGSDFSFSGLKTAVRQAAERNAPLSDKDVGDLCAAFQEMVARTVGDRVENAIGRFRSVCPEMAGGALVVAGGVAANKAIRGTLATLTERNGMKFIAPPPELCSDNAAMIAHAAIEHMRAGTEPGDSLAAAPRARWPLDEGAAPKIGSGKRGVKA